ncbi:phenylacetate-CoA oxygenase subunit PaaJ [Streptacidiphilus sp. NEAU-YB345]|uniref:Phenylacetate-CoA oxygenase subunit PaaJ n=1 Tax=Streptacidiphilus fuscans TaxID=2789292 RepID=A0A931BDH6_9ACTN|nr:1,2-phenylacetyl-CoA epoxidase subunit PaaD [Streptacidiphilus fuscans]MBF9073606.1 phenylacetate-CoA oxygenase subunit PaaJ [Streptacidiphilus fuscans]
MSATARPALDAGLDAALDDARAAAESVCDPELPMLTLADLGVLRDVRIEDDGAVTAVLTPTYSGCPALAEMRADLDAALRSAGFSTVHVRTELSPPWSTDDITAEGRRKLAESGIAPPGRAPRRSGGPIPVTLTLGPRTTRTEDAVRCPRCGSPDTEETSRFGATACKALRRCRACREPFEQVKEI